jgi:glutamyl-tRNA synthetase
MALSLETIRPDREVRDQTKMEPALNTPTLPAKSLPPIGRLAPSPTGGLHVGHARTFLIAWLSARHSGGRVILRLEDLDATRARAEAASGILADLRWLGLDWDEGPDVGGPSAPYVQSERLAIYREALERLKRAELVYPCTCTRADIERAATAPHAEDEGPVYPGTCRHRIARDAEALGDRPFAWRFRVPAESIAWHDLVAGAVCIRPAQTGGDFVVARSNGSFSYQLAVAADDAAMGVTQVIRGLDLMPSTPRQILLYRALGWPEPDFGHVPLVVGPDGRRLAKRDASIKLATLREHGVDPRWLVGWLAHSCGWAERPILSDPECWIERFGLGAIPSSPCVVSAEILGNSREG